MTLAVTLAATERMAAVAAPVVGQAKGLELARNVATALLDGDDPYQCAVEAIVHRIACGWLSVGRVADLAQSMARAWRNA